MKWISVKDELPKDGQEVLIWNNGYEIARFTRGITEEEREKMKNGELPNPKSQYWSATSGWEEIERSNMHSSGDVWGNNLVPYCWEVHGGAVFIHGQNIKYWMPTPEPPNETKEQ